MAGLTKRQADLLAYLTAYLAENGGVSPSFDEMQAHLDLASKSGVHRLIMGLERRGMIRRVAHSARSISVVRAERIPTDADLDDADLDSLLSLANRVALAVSRRSATTLQATAA